MRTPSSYTVLILVLLLPACGGGGGDGDGDLPLFEIAFQRVQSTPSRTGTVYEMGAVEVGAAVVAAGDLGSGSGVRAFHSFPLDALPALDRIDSVDYVDGLTGSTGDPFSLLGDLLISRTDLGPSLDSSDYDGPAIRVALGILSSVGGTGERTVDLTSYVRSVLEGGGSRIDLMIAFEQEAEDNDQPDMQWLRSAASAEGPGYLRVGVRIQP